MLSLPFLTNFKVANAIYLKCKNFTAENDQLLLKQHSFCLVFVIALVEAMNYLTTGSKIVLLICLLIHPLTDQNWMISLFSKHDSVNTNFFIGASYLLFPILGWIADVQIPRYKMIKLSLILNLFAGVLALLIVINLQLKYFPSTSFFHFVTAISIFTLVFYVGSMGIYKANAIQFGLQQLQDASSETLSSFIHWYYWSINLSSLSVFYVSAPVLLYYRKCKIDLNEKFKFNSIRNEQNLQIVAWLLFFPLVLAFICVSTGLIVLIFSVNKLDVHQVKMNPFKIIFKILQYTWKQKYPERRSAFTYWENKEPSRIDFGKQKYGGPFTNEEVEDMKTFFRLLTLMLSLFGFFLGDDIQSLSSLVMRHVGCPKLTQFFMMVLSSNHIQLLIIIIGVPLYQLLIKKICIKYIPNLLTRIGIGLILCLIKQLAYPIVIYLINTKDQQALSCGVKTLAHSYSTTTLCLFANGQVVNNNGTCVPFCPEMITESDIFYLLLIPQIIEGVSSLLVFMTMLEFICAQAPHTMKGLLIGIWYAMLSIQYMGINYVKTNLDASNNSEWCVYGGVKGSCIFVSTVLYFVACKYYHYRERDEVVNEQAIIEDLYERELMYETEDSQSTHSS